MSSKDTETMISAPTDTEDPYLPATMRRSISSSAKQPDTEDPYLPATRRSISSSAKQSATMTYESRPSTEQPATATMTYESRPSTMTYEDHCPSDERSAKQSATLTSANQSDWETPDQLQQGSSHISVHIADDDSETDAAPIVPVKMKNVKRSSTISVHIADDDSDTDAAPIVPASALISSVSYVPFRSVPSAVLASSSVSVSASVPVSSSVPASAFVSSVSSVPFRLFDPENWLYGFRPAISAPKSSICNICVTVFDLPDWLYGFRPAIGLRPYYGESTRSHPNSEVKHHQAHLVLRWGTLGVASAKSPLSRAARGPKAVRRLRRPP